MCYMTLLSKATFITSFLRSTFCDLKIPRHLFERGCLFRLWPTAWISLAVFIGLGNCPLMDKPSNTRRKLAVSSLLCSFSFMGHKKCIKLKSAYL